MNEGRSGAAHEKGLDTNLAARALRCRDGSRDARTLTAPFGLARSPEASRAVRRSHRPPSHGFALQQRSPGTRREKPFASTASVQQTIEVGVTRNG